MNMPKQLKIEVIVTFSFCLSISNLAYQMKPNITTERLGIDLRTPSSDGRMLSFFLVTALEPRLRS